MSPVRIRGYRPGDLSGLYRICLETFARRLEQEWWPPLRLRYADPDVTEREHWTRDQELEYVIHHPWQTEDDLITWQPCASADRVVCTCM